MWLFFNYPHTSSQFAWSNMNSPVQVEVPEMARYFFSVSDRLLQTLNHEMFFTFIPVLKILAKNLTQWPMCQFSVVIVLIW